MRTLLRSAVLAAALAGVWTGGATAQQAPQKMGASFLLPSDGLIRPVMSPVQIPRLPEKSSFCTAAEKDAYIALLKERAQAAEANVAAGRTYTEQLDARLKALLANPAANTKAIERFRTEMDDFDAPYSSAFRMGRELRTAATGIAQFPVKPCADAPVVVAEAAPAASAIVARPIVPPVTPPAPVIAKPVLPIISPPAPPAPSPDVTPPAPVVQAVAQPAASATVVRPAAAIAPPAPAGELIVARPNMSAPVAEDGLDRVVQLAAAPSRPAPAAAAPAAPAPTPAPSPLDRIVSLSAAPPAPPAVPVARATAPLPTLLLDRPAAGNLPARTVQWTTRGADGRPFTTRVTLTPAWSVKGRNFTLFWDAEEAGHYGFDTVQADWTNRPGSLEANADEQISYIIVTLDTGRTFYFKRPDRTERTMMRVATRHTLDPPREAGAVTKIEMVFGWGPEGATAVWEFASPRAEMASASR